MGWGHRKHQAGEPKLGMEAEAVSRARGAPQSPRDSSEVDAEPQNMRLRLGQETPGVHDLERKTGTDIANSDSM